MTAPAVSEYRDAEPCPVCGACFRCKHGEHEGSCHGCRCACNGDWAPHDAIRCSLSHTEYRILLPITKPLLQNERLHWAAKNRRTQEIRRAVALLVKTKPYRIPHLERCTVQLEWRPRTAHRRDGDGPAPTIKAATDGLVDAGVLDDDDTSRVTHLPVVILPLVPREPARLWLVVRPVEEAA
jgi:crossover junction endodeoxyribonuclease RusA